MSQTIIYACDLCGDDYRPEADPIAWRVKVQGSSVEVEVTLARDGRRLDTCPRCTKRALSALQRKIKA